MKITAKNLDAILRNCEPNEYLRDKVGSALCRVLYDYAGDRYDNDEEYKELGDAAFYNCPSEDEIFKCFDYMWEHDMMDIELTLNLD